MKKNVNASSTSPVMNVSPEMKGIGIQSHKSFRKASRIDNAGAIVRTNVPSKAPTIRAPITNPIIISKVTISTRKEEKSRI